MKQKNLHKPMKWCIIVNGAPFLTEFLGKLCYSLLKEGDECVLVFTSKIAEYTKRQCFPKEVRTISKVDWCLKHHDFLPKDLKELTWRELYPAFDRMELWPWGYQESVQCLEQEYQFFEQFLQKERPDAILFEPPAGVPGTIAHLLSLRHDIAYLGITESRIAGHLDVYDFQYTDKRYQQTFRTLALKDISIKEKQFAKRFIREFISHKRLPSYFKTGKIRFTLFSYMSHYVARVQEVGGMLLRYLSLRKKFKNIDFESEMRLRVAIKAPFELAFRQVRIALQKRLYGRLKPNDEFYLFPLHLQPEASTSVRAMQYSDQASTILNIAFALPFPCKLYVREHPSAIGKKSNAFYQKIQSIPNVELIAPEENMQKLIVHSQGVITLTGTTGMEAALVGKPAYVLGNAFYSYHPLCRKPKNMDELREYILRDRKEGVLQKNLEEENLRFVVSYARNTILGSTSAATATQDKNQYKRIARELKSIVRMRKKPLLKKQGSHL